VSHLESHDVDGFIQVCRRGRWHAGSRIAYEVIFGHFSSDERIVAMAETMQLTIGPKLLNPTNFQGKPVLFLTDKNLMVMTIDRSQPGEAKGMTHNEYLVFPLSKIRSVSQIKKNRYRIEVVGSDNLEVRIFPKIAPLLRRVSTEFYEHLLTLIGDVNS
jgi:hypothetical protein